MGRKGHSDLRAQAYPWTRKWIVHSSISPKTENLCFSSDLVMRPGIFPMKTTLLSSYVGTRKIYTSWPRATSVGDTQSSWSRGKPYSSKTYSSTHYCTLLLQHSLPLVMVMWTVRAVPDMRRRSHQTPRHRYLKSQNSQALASQMHRLHNHILTAASYHFSVGVMGSGTGFWNWMRKMKRRRRKMKRRRKKSIFGNVQRNCNWIWRIKGQAGMLGAVQKYSTYLPYLSPSLASLSGSSGSKTKQSKRGLEELHRRQNWGPHELRCIWNVLECFGTNHRS